MSPTGFVPGKEAGMDGENLVKFWKISSESSYIARVPGNILGSYCIGEKHEVKSGNSYGDEVKHVTAVSCAAQSDAKRGERRILCYHPGNSTHLVNKNILFSRGTTSLQICNCDGRNVPFYIKKHIVVKATEARGATGGGRTLGDLRNIHRPLLRQAFPRDISLSVMRLTLP